MIGTVLSYLVVAAGAAGVGYGLGRRTERTTHRFAVDDADGENAPLTAALAAVSERTEERFARILAQARTDGRITNDGVEELFCISDRTASKYLRQLTADGRLRRRGRGRGTYYVPGDK